MLFISRSAYRPYDWYELLNATKYSLVAVSPVANTARNNLVIVSTSRTINWSSQIAEKDTWHYLEALFVFQESIAFVLSQSEDIRKAN